MRQAILLTAGVLLFGASAVAQDFEWTGDADTDGWHDKKLISPSPRNYVNNWGVTGDPPALPGAGDDVEIHPPTPTLVRVNGGPVTIQSLHLGGDNTLRVDEGNHLTLGADCTIDGSLILADTAAGLGTYVYVDADLTLGGIGSFGFGSIYSNHIENVDPGDALTVGSDFTVYTGTDCEGNIDTPLTNDGLVNANVGGTIYLRQTTTNSSTAPSALKTAARSRPVQSPSTTIPARRLRSRPAARST